MSICLSANRYVSSTYTAIINSFSGKTMKHLFIAVMLLVISIPCFSESCLDSPEYKNSVVIFKAAISENAIQLEKAVDFLSMTKGLSFNQALGEVMRFSTPETVKYDKLLNEIGEKIRPMNPQSPKECSELIKLQREYEAIGKDKIHFIVNKIMEEPKVIDSNTTVNTDITR
jgi:hypothetical protein